MTTTSRWRALTHHHLFWPVAILVALLLVNVPFTPDFFSIRMTNGHLHGSLVSIVLFGSPLILVAVGMTLVIATGGIDLSVGAVVAIAGALACLSISGQADQNSVSGVLLALGLALVAALVCGLWNGVLVARMGIQPIIATLIIMVAGRGLAQLITDGQIITVNSEPYKLIGGGYWLGVPFSILLAGAIVALAALLTRRTALGVLLESVGVERIVAAMVVWSQVWAVGYLAGPALAGVLAEAAGFAAIGLLPLAVAVPVVVLSRVRSPSRAPGG